MPMLPTAVPRSVFDQGDGPPLRFQGELDAVRGQAHPQARLTDQVIEQIRRLNAIEGVSYAELARRYAHSRGGIAKICRGERRANPAR
jgi:hypothetical protein